MKNISVAAAIIKREGLILTAKRGYGKYIDFWEFPGGKVEENETLEQALHREIMEELELEVQINSPFISLEYDYPDFHVSLHCFLCSMKSNTIQLKEHKEIRWLTMEELDSVQWLPANAPIIEQLKMRLV